MKLHTGKLLKSAVVACLGVVAAMGQETPVVSSLESPTPVRRGRLTQTQKEHSKLYSGQSVGTNKLTDFEERDVISYVSSHFGTGGGSDTRSVTERVHRRTCEADVVVRAVVKSKTSQFTVDETYIFTDYTMSVLDILKDDRRGSLKPAGSILVSRPGGAVRFDGKTVTQVNSNERPFLQSNRYLLFLKRISGSVGFTLSEGSVLIDSEGETGLLSERPGFREFLFVNADLVVDAVKANDSANCPR
jgi:hypothetical protein